MKDQTSVRISCDVRDRIYDRKVISRMRTFMGVRWQTASADRIINYLLAVEKAYYDIMDEEGWRSGEVVTDAE